MNNSIPHWPAELYRALADADVRQIGYVPDAGHRHLLDLAEHDAAMTSVSLTTEQEGMALAAGAWLGGQRSAVLMQSSGLGNCINAIASISQACQFPLLMLITMRGEWGEANPWQVPMGRAVEPVLAALDVQLARLDDEAHAYATVDALARLCFTSNRSAALLIGQRLIGAKEFKQ